MNNSVLDIKERVAKWINHHPVTLVLSATTGHSVKQYFPLVESDNVQLIIVVAHRIGNPRWKPFDPKIKNEIEQRGGIILQEKMLGAIRRVSSMAISKYLIPWLEFREKNWEELLAVGGRVCLQVAEMAAKENLITKGSTIVVVAGENAALALKLKNISPPHLTLIDIIHRNNI